MGKMKQYEWLDRTIMYSPFHYALCTSEEGFRKLCKKIGLDESEIPDFLENGSMDACVLTFEKGYTLFCVVNIDADNEGSNTEVNGLLTHEAVHVWQKIRKFIGERKPSSEFEAYAIQNISQNLMESYKRQTSKKPKKGKK